MKKIILLLTLSLSLLNFVNAQTPPNAFNYSAVARNAAGQPIATTTIGIQVSILKTSPTGASQYSENHFVNTDAFGLFNLVIGAGALQSGSMTTIDWSNDNYYLKVGMDINGGTNFLTMGTTQLLSVPYALYAKNAGSVSGGNNFSGNYNDLTNAPTNVSAFNNDAGYLTNANDNQQLSVSLTGDTLYLQNGGFVIIPGISQANSTQLQVGDFYQGGYIAYILQPTDAGYDPNVQHGIIVAPNDETAAPWGCQGVALSNTSNAVGTGSTNTLNILNGCQTLGIAARICDDLILNGYSDWYLPSYDDIWFCYTNLFSSNIGGFSPIAYSTSTEWSANSVKIINFNGGSMTADFKSYSYSFRAARNF
jgi:hypothetical protein